MNQWGGRFLVESLEFKVWAVPLKIGGWQHEREKVKYDIPTSTEVGI